MSDIEIGASTRCFLAVLPLPVDAGAKMNAALVPAVPGKLADPHLGLSGVRLVLDVAGLVAHGQGPGMF